MPEGPGTFFGRTQLRPPSAPLEVSGGVLRLRVDSYNPTALRPGDSFWGSEIVTRQPFPLGTGVTFVARGRVVAPVSGGLVASLFAYALRGGGRDEIDFEFLTNDAGTDRILTNLFFGEPFNVAGRPRVVRGANQLDFSELHVEWRPDHIRWKVNGLVVREEFERIPDQPMSIRLNFWAAAADFPAAFNPTLQPAVNARDNQTFFYEIDFVEVSALP